MELSKSDVVQRAEAILAKAKDLEDDDPSSQSELLKQLELLQRELEPSISLFFKTWISLTVFTCLDIVVKSGILDKMKTRENITARELGPLVNMDINVIGQERASVLMHKADSRVMRVLVAAGLIASPSEDTYSHTAKSSIYVKGEHTAVDSFNMLTLLNVSYMTIPQYLQTRSAQDLLDIRKTPYACAYGMEGRTFYETLSANPDHLDTFNKAMSEPGPDYGIFPFSLLKEDVLAEPERAFLVDIGGGKGQALLHIRKETGHIFGSGAKMILQERPDVLEQIRPEEMVGIETMPYDFHTEQPVKGAHVYHLSQIIHNYPDHVCWDILSRVAEAMNSSSRLLIVEAVLPAQTEVGGDMGGYLIDFVGLAMGGKERTEKEFATLLDVVGLEIVKVWPGKARYQAVVEARLREG
ncbi:MAG: hypothetical protein Q9182_000874 [Xanthomendoza sp. 2 TL-2023]